MDAGEVIKNILDYFHEGYYKEGFSFFRRSSEPLKERLREAYFNSYRNRNEPLCDELRPRTGDFISAVLSSIFLGLSEKASFDSSLKEEIIKKLICNGYSHLFDNEGKNNSNNDKR